MDQGQNNNQPTAPENQPQASGSGGAPAPQPQQAQEPKDTVVGKTDATTYAVGSQNSNPAGQGPMEHESVADKLFAPFKKLMGSGSAPRNEATNEPEKLTQDQPHVATPSSESQPQG